MASTRGPRLQGSGNQLQTAQARVYALTPSKADNEAEDVNVVTGTIPLYGSLACTLFDSGARHSFVFTTYAKPCDMNIEPLRQSIREATPVGDSLACRKVVENCPIIIGGRILLANLVVF
jgi:hypothetical protein